LLSHKRSLQVVNALTDLRDLKPGGDGSGLGYINDGSSVVYTLNVATAGTYNVVYSLSGVNGSPAGINVIMSLHKGILHFTLHVAAAVVRNAKACMSQRKTELNLNILLCLITCTIIQVVLYALQRLERKEQLLYQTSLYHHTSTVLRTLR
jgi:hypothetical protein